MWSVRTSLASRSTQSTTIIVWQCQRILRLAVAEHQKKTCMAAPSVARALRRRRRRRVAFRRTSQSEKDSRFSFFFLLLASPLQLCAVYQLAVPIERTPYPTTIPYSISMLWYAMQLSRSFGKAYQYTYCWRFQIRARRNASTRQQPFKVDGIGYRVLQQKDGPGQQQQVFFVLPCERKCQPCTKTVTKITSIFRLSL